MFPEAEHPDGDDRDQSERYPRRADFSRVDEYIFFVFLGERSAGAVDVDDADGMTRVLCHAGSLVHGGQAMSRGGSNDEAERKPNLFYPIFIEAETDAIVEVGDPASDRSRRARGPDVRR